MELTNEDLFKLIKEFGYAMYDFGSARSDEHIRSSSDRLNSALAKIKSELNVDDEDDLF
jgi:hypothetical protein